MPTAPADRNYTNELTGILGGLDSTTASYVRSQIQNNPALTQNNIGNFTSALRGNFDAVAFDQANPGFLTSFQEQQNAGQLAGWTPAQYAAAYTGKQGNDPSLNAYYKDGIGTQMRTAYDQANPDLVGYNATLKSTMDRLNAQPAPSYNPSGYFASGSGNQAPQSAALASFAPQAASQQMANAFTARQQMASGGPLLGGLQQDAAGALGQVSPLQMQQQRIAQSLLGSASGLSQGEIAGVQDASRAAYADRGLVRSNRGIGAEILNTDAAQRGRLMQNLGLAQGVDAAGQTQLNAGRNYALGVQGQGQQLSQFNAGQGNQLGQFNAGNLTGISQFNAGQGNALGQFNAGQFNSIGASLANSNADRLNNMGQFNAQLGQANNQFNAGQVNNAAQFNSTASNQSGQFNATMLGQNANDQWGRASGYGQYLGGQALNPTSAAAGLIGAAPDYTGSLLNYGQDVNNTNYNAANARYISANNNSAAKTGAGLGALGSLGGALIGGGTGAGSVLGSLGGLLGFCWVARSVYGAHDPKWLRFRGWLLTRGSTALLAAYVARGPRLAQRVQHNPALRARLRTWMDARIAELSAPLPALN